MVLSHVIFWRLLILILWSHVIVTCDAIFTVWHDALDDLEMENGNWILNGSVNPTDSNYCPTSRKCVQIESQSSIKTSIATRNYLNFTLLFGITISQSGANSTGHDTDIDDYCCIYYKINKNKINTNTSGSAHDQNWKLLASYLYDVTTDFNNKLASQSFELAASASHNNEYYESIDLQFVNRAKTRTQKSCFIDEISLIAQFYSAPSEPFRLNTLHLVIGVFSIIFCALIVAFFLLYFYFASLDKYRSQLQNIQALKMVDNETSTEKISISAVPISADFGDYHTQEQNDPSVNNLHATDSKQTETDCNNSEKDNVPNPGICTPEFIEPTISGSTQMKLDRIMTEVLNKNDDNVAQPSSRRDTELSTRTVTSFQTNINLTLYNIDLYEGAMRNMHKINDELDYVYNEEYASNSPSFNTPTNENDHESLSFDTSDIYHVSGLKNRYPSTRKSGDESNDNKKAKMKFTKSTENEEEESLDIGSIACNTVSTSTISRSRSSI